MRDEDDVDDDDSYPGGIATSLDYDVLGLSLTLPSLLSSHFLGFSAAG